MKKINIVTLIILASLSLLFAQGVKDKFLFRNHPAYNKTIPYRLFIPENYSEQEYYPLVIYLHSAGARGNNNIDQLATGATRWAEEETQQQYPCFVMAPQCPDNHFWWSQFDVLNHLLMSLMDEFNIDSTRLYLTGHSMGASGIWEIIPMSPIHFAAVIPVAGDGDIEVLPLVSYIPPIWNFHGTIDDFVDVEGSREMINTLENILGIEAVYPDLKNGVPSGLTEAQLDSAIAAGAPLIYTEKFAGHHNINESVYDDPKVRDWMFSRKTDFILPQTSQGPTSPKSSSLSHVTTLPVLERGLTGSWEGWAVSEPTVIKEGDTLKMWYVGWQAGWGLTTHIGFAWSLNGINWNRYSENPVLTTDLAWEGIRLNRLSVIKDDDIYRMWYSAGDKSGFSTNIGYAWSEDGLIWTKHPEPVLLPGNIDEWDYYNITVGTVIKEQSGFKMWYHGGTWMTGGQIGYATSVDGINWTKYNNPETEELPYQISDPILSTGRFLEDWDFHGLWYPIVYSGSKGYEMWYSGSTMGCVGFLHYATSTDGIDWYKSESNPVLSHPPVWAADPGYVGGSVLKYDDEYHLWFSDYNYETGMLKIGYVKDFSKIAHTDSIAINKTFYEAGFDTLEVETRVVNPFGHDLALKAYISSEDSVVDHYVPMSNNGNSIWVGKWAVPEGERIYSLSIQTTDLDSGTVHQSVEAIKKHFTTIGPVVSESYTVTKPPWGTLYTVELFLRNNGSITTAQNINAQITSIDTNVTKIDPDNQSFGNIDPGQTNGSSPYIIDIQMTPDSVKLDIRIFSEGTLYWEEEIPIDLRPVSVGTEVAIPLTFELEQNYPNPFNPGTMIKYQLPKISEVQIKIYNLLGQKIATLVDRRQNAGTYQVEWNASAFASGVYYYKIEAGEFQDVKKMILLR